jgi:predicted nucleic acid-binding protein
LIVIDASVLAPALVADTAFGDRLRARLVGERLAAPALIDVEVVATWRGLARARRLRPGRVATALADLAAMPMLRAEHERLMPRVWQLRHNLSPYDASYVALAEYIDTVLLTGDERLARAPRIRCEVEVLQVE